MLAKYSNKEHFMTEFNKIPNCVRKRMAGMMMKKMLSRDVFTQGFIDGSARYWSLMLERLGRQEIVILVWSYYLGHLHNSFFTKDRMLQDFDFPIAFCNGTRDFFGSAEGSNTIV